MKSIELRQNINPQLKELFDSIKEHRFDDAQQLLNQITQEIVDINSIYVPITITTTTHIIEEFGYDNTFVPENMSHTTELDKNIPFVHWISSFRGIDAIRFLLTEGFDINIIDEEGYTALYHVINNSYTNTNYSDSYNTQNQVNFLLNNGANPNIFGPDHLGMPDYQKSPIYLGLYNPSILNSILTHNSNLQDFQKEYRPFVNYAISRCISDFKYSEDSLKLLLSHSEMPVIYECFSFFSKIFTVIPTESELARFHKFFNIFITSFGLPEKSYKDFATDIKSLKETNSADCVSYDLGYHYIDKIIDQIVGFGKHPIFENPDLRHKVLSYLINSEAFIFLKTYVPVVLNNPVLTSGGGEETKTPDLVLSGDVLEDTGV